MKNKLLAVSTTALLAVSLSAAAGLSTKEQKVSYSMGFETGKAMRSHDITIDQNAYALGLKEGVAGQSKTMTQDQIKQTIVEFQKDSIAKFKAV